MLRLHHSEGFATGIYFTCFTTHLKLVLNYAKNQTLPRVTFLKSRPESRPVYVQSNPQACNLLLAQQ